MIGSRRSLRPMAGFGALLVIAAGLVAVTPSAAASLNGEDTHTIGEIQGEGSSTPLEGQTVTTSGVVTAAYPTGGFDGYYIQTPGTGGDTDLTERTVSDAVFVYSPATVSEVEIGDHVRVTGTATEYHGLTQVTVEAGALVGLDEPAESVKPVAFELPRAPDRREVFEGMLVHPTAGYVVSDTYNLGGWGDTAFGSIGLGYGGALRQETDVAAPGTDEFDDVVADNAARSVTLDDGQSQRTSSDDHVPYLSADSGVRTGAELTFTDSVIFDYRFQWNFQPTTPVDGAAPELVTFGQGNTRQANAEPADVGGELRLASFNVLNYFTSLGEDEPGCEAYEDRDGNPLTADYCDVRGAYTPQSLARQEGKLVTAINGLDADVVALQEIENGAKFGRDRDAAVADLVEALNAEAGPDTWDYVSSPTEQPDVAEQDVIRTAYLYRPEAVEPTGESRILEDSPAFDNAREPLAQEFGLSGSDYSFVAVTNHFKSKGGDCGDPQPPEGCFNADRVAQSEALVGFADDVATERGVEDVFLLGDFNAYSAEAPVTVLEDAGYTNLNSGPKPGEPTYVYDGKVGSLDHVFANATAAEKVTGTDVWRINAAESVLAEYSRHNYFASHIFQPGTPFRASDHEPIVVGLDPSGAAVGFEQVLARVRELDEQGELHRRYAAPLSAHLATAQRFADRDAGAGAQVERALDRADTVVSQIPDDDVRAELAGLIRALRATR
ncbi:MAG TPA: ExeM/NucH family extracellular endonuclease [Jiangellaceae bacterium]|nr:ExeM/NucH family extracellular endonuclease [Jiangellaceae bacterium]